MCHAFGIGNFASTTHAQPRAIRWDDPRTTADLRAALVRADYTVSGIRTALGTGEEFTSGPADIPVHLRRLPPEQPLSTLIKLFLLGVPVDPDESRRALTPLSLESLERLGVVEAGEAGIRASVRVLPHENLVIACDRRPEPGEDGLPADWVTGLDPPAILLASLTVRRPVRASLDLGTGCGIQALLAAQHSQKVVAVDINPRALMVVEFNARLNGITNIDCRQGNLFEPVEGLAFDLIVCNPPYVISPDHDYVFRDSGLPGDSLCRTVVQQAPRFLTDGGFAETLVSWVTRPREDWSVPLRAWTAGSGCDTWLLHGGTEDPLTHAAKWNRPTDPHALTTFPQTLDRWLAYYRRSCIEAIAFGAVIQRRQSGRPNWIRADELPSGRPGAAGDHIGRVFTAQDYLQTLSSEQGLLDGVFRLAEGIRLEQTLVSREQAWQLQGMALTLESGLRFVGGSDVQTASVLTRIDGRTPLRLVLQEAARAGDVAGPAEEAFMAAALPVVRRLLELGFLAPAESPIAPSGT